MDRNEIYTEYLIEIVEKLKDSMLSLKIAIQQLENAIKTMKKYD